MNDMTINALYPAGKFDSSMMIQDGSKELFDFMGEYVYSPLYKMVRKEDIGRLEAAMQSCTENTVVDECVQLLNEHGEYEKFVLSVHKCAGKKEFYYIEFQNLSADNRQMKSLKEQLASANDFLTATGNHFFTYKPQTNRFHMFWTNYEQRINVFDADFDEWTDKMARDEMVTGQDKAVFETFCQVLRSAERSQTFSFRGSILTKGGNKDSYRVKFFPRRYGDEKIVIGTWMIVNGQTGNGIDDYVEGSYVDSLTRILNKRAITEYAEEAVAAGGQIALTMIDIDNFKDVNDTYGHLFGDQVIAATADIAKKVVGDNGAVGRMGGDEFMVVLNSYKDEEDLRNYLRGIKMGVASLFQDRLGTNKLSCSIGTARAGIDASDYKGLFRIADKALYIAKQKGRNRFIIYKPELHGKFNVSGNDYDMQEIRESFYSDKDLYKFNELLAKVVLHGSASLPEFLEHAARTLMLSRLIVIWGEPRSVVGVYPSEIPWPGDKLGLFESPQYLGQFEDDMLMITNVNMLEFSMPEAYAFYNESHVLCLMQHILRDKDGQCAGMVTAEECVNVRHFPKLAQQMFENMSRILNAVLINES